MMTSKPLCYLNDIYLRALNLVDWLGLRFLLRSLLSLLSHRLYWSLMFPIRFYQHVHTCLFTMQTQVRGGPWSLVSPGSAGSLPASLLLHCIAGVWSVNIRSEGTLRWLPWTCLSRGCVCTVQTRPKVMWGYVYGRCAALKS
jgi:hypothetical protein